MNLEQMNDEELLQEAVKQGFNPEFEGENKKTPKEFLEISNNHRKILLERNEKLSRDIDNLQSKMERLIQFQEEQKQKAVDKAVRQLKEQRKEAISDGDVERVEVIDKEIHEQQQVAKPENNPILDEWLSRNPWYLKDNSHYDEELAIEADIIAKQLGETGRFDTTQAQEYKRLLNQVESRLKKSFPDKFRNPKKDNPPDVESGRPSSEESQSKKTFADLPSDAKRICDQFVKDGIFKNREEYLAIYEWDD